MKETIVESSRTEEGLTWEGSFWVPFEEVVEASAATRIRIMKAREIEVEGGMGERRG